ncbi:MAG: ATP-binding cassette domain-containing protein, partial [Spirochaetales bacterium]|nr:ATP-binding cassette domain-containing protein [Spirochaetales bacterium]
MLSYSKPDSILEVKDLKQYFYPNRNKVVKAVNGVSFQIKRGSTFGLVGESGSGKSTIGRSLIRLYDPTAGNVLFNGVEIGGKLNSENRRLITQKMQ